LFLIVPAADKASEFVSKCLYQYRRHGDPQRGGRQTSSRTGFSAQWGAVQVIEFDALIMRIE
jgi:hypothetical protein